MVEITAVKAHEKFEGVYWVFFEDGSKRLATINLTPGKRVYGELLVKYKEVEYRIWNPYRSKLAAAILKGLEVMPLKKGMKVLYLGAASGTTASHVSDIVGNEGIVYCIEFSPRVMRELVERASRYRKNMVPVLADARFPAKYSWLIEGVDLIYADIAQPFQSKIVADNADMFLRKEGWVMQAIKAMSIDVTREPSETYKQEIGHLEERGYKIENVVHLEPYDEAHAFVVALKLKK
ncbi:MAG: fibrillarin-like rRNA/tRNA 2'-O-methyltransferase [Thermoproteales archaeon]|nr:fibrillarin-like rRNA/tRNA 2'-O-methyltransferase [Thermoproteales archaeon]RLE65873.1 MAG: fibrillarin-like rRNA/tRNA 2'-O-methyltransferase [Thermoprotei archaeon]